MAHTEDGAEGGRVGDPVLIAAGAADLVIEGIGTALRRTGALLGRSDLAELARDGREELRQRGILALRRYSPTPESHMELLARRAASREPGRGDA
ncbi:hypothetical protein SAMN05421803_108114 [Nocardiopsis flavescens]|uniref:Polyprenyl synthetase n=1 Tax=Nocardiopsis flavescens TaxID=758803 RepID=A0A1M6L847_9ACTN|nr:hypothetical protein [Nocardiopsis flavescens]SHJ67355.1 hypothetical protein SAMN05421803_108114 [Nocardiopsis flavescens]